MTNDPVKAAALEAMGVLFARLDNDASAILAATAILAVAVVKTADEPLEHFTRRLHAMDAADRSALS